jgi:transposase InsO family protein
LIPKRVRTAQDHDFTAIAPNRKWAGDISHIWTAEGWLYLAEVIDLHSRCVIGWAVNDRMIRDLAIRAFAMVARLRDPKPGCIFNSDRGSQFASGDYKKRLAAYKMLPSKSGKGCCYDNAAVETLFQNHQSRTDLAPQLAHPPASSHRPLPIHQRPL